MTRAGEKLLVYKIVDSSVTQAPTNRISPNRRVVDLFTLNQASFNTAAVRGYIPRYIHAWHV